MRERGLVRYPDPNVVDVDHEALDRELDAIVLPGEPEPAIGAGQPAAPEAHPTTREFLFRLREHFGLGSDYALAKRLGVTQKTVKTWRAGRGGFSDEMAMRVEDELRLPRGYVVAAMHAERSTGTIQTMWERLATLARRSMPGIALATITVAGGVGAPTPSQAATGHFAESVYYGKSRRWGDRLATA